MYFKVFCQSDFISYSYQVSPAVFQVSEPISAFRRSGLVLLFPTLCRMWGSDRVAPSLDEAFRLRTIGWFGMSRATEAHMQHQLERSRKTSCWACNHASEAHTHLIWWPSRAMLGWMGAHPRGALMSARPLPAELRNEILWPPRELSARTLFVLPYMAPKEEKKLLTITINYSLFTIN